MLRINYRTSRQIREAADHLLPPAVRDADGLEDDRRGAQSVFEGPAPVVALCTDQDAETEAVAVFLRSASEDGIAASEMGLFVRSAELLSRARAAVAAAGLEARQLTERAEDFGECVSIGTMHLAKGLEFKAVDGDKLKEGEILFRYAGQSSRIKFTDLRELLAERDRKAQLALAGAAGKLATVGTANALILDTDKNVLDADGREILIDEELAKGINFIREGQFDEVDGAPTLKLVGEVKPVNVQSLLAEKHIDKAISQERILEAFLAQETVTNPKEYVLAAVSQPRKWLPLFYFTNQAGLTPAAMIDEVKTLATSQKEKKKTVIKRLSGKETAHTSSPTKKANSVAFDVEQGKAKVPTKLEDVGIFCQAICSISKTKMALADALAALKQCYDLAAADSNALSFVFKAACRLDELFCQTA